MASHRAGVPRTNPNPGYTGRHTGPHRVPRIDPTGRQPVQPDIPLQYQNPYPAPQPIQQPTFLQQPTQPPMPPQAEQTPKRFGVGTVVVVGLVGVLVGWVLPHGTNAPAKPAAAITLKTDKGSGTGNDKDIKSTEPSPSPAARYVKMPDLVGKNAAVAQDELVQLGFDKFDDIELGSKDVLDTVVLLPANWTVAEQSHPAGSRVKIGTKIVLVCTKNR